MVDSDVPGPTRCSDGPTTSPRLSSFDSPIASIVASIASSPDVAPAGPGSASTFVLIDATSFGWSGVVAILGAPSDAVVGSAGSGSASVDVVPDVIVVGFAGPGLAFILAGEDSALISSAPVVVATLASHADRVATSLASVPGPTLGAGGFG